MSCVINPYDLLGVTIKSSKDEIRKKYYELSLLVHPDKGGTGDDMMILHSAYKFIIREIENIDNSLTIEKLESEFKDFCDMQQKTIPLFQDIYAEAFDLPKFNTKFEDAICDGEYVFMKPFLDGGYGDLMEKSDIDFLSNITNISYKDKADEPITNMFNAISIYDNHINEQTFFNNVYDYTASKVDNYSLDMNGLSMCDYKEAFTPVIYKDSNDDTLQTKSIDDLVKERESKNNDDDKYANYFNDKYGKFTWSFAGFMDPSGNVVKNTLKLE